MLISKQVKADYSKRPVRLPYRTPGFYGHAPKFWNCRKRDWVYYGGPYSREDPVFAEHMREYMNEQKEIHSKCRIPWHISYVGYLVYVLPPGKKLHRIVWWYMGNPYRSKRLEFQENHEWN